MKALITGGTGYLAGSLARTLVGAGWSVGLVSRSDSARARSPSEFMVHSMAAPGELPGVLASACPDVVFHLAALTTFEHRPEDVGPMVEANVALGTHLLEAMSLCGCRRLVNVSTAWLHYLGRDYDPVCLYAATKKAFEDIVEYYVAAKDLRAITLELFDTYGPSDPRPKLIPKLLRASAEEEIHVADVAEAQRLAAERVSKASPGHARYSVSSGRPITLRDLVTRIERLIGRALPIVWGGRPYRHREVMEPGSPTPVLPEWAPRVSLEAGLREVVQGV